MSNINALASMLRDAKKRNDNYIKYGTINAGRVLCGGKAYPFDAACAVPVRDGCGVFFQLTANNVAIIVGA